MSDKIIQLNEDLIKHDLKDLVRSSVEETLNALLDKYKNTDIYEIEKTDILKLDPFIKYGKPSKIASYFGSRDAYLKAVQELENEIYTDEVG